MEKKLKLPKKKEEVSMRDQVRADLQEAGVQITRDMQIYESNKAIFDNPETSREERAEILEDLINIIEADLGHIEEARGLPGIQINERTPEYREEMEKYVQGLRNTLGNLKKTRLSFVDEYTKS
ncbi:hypothetical protein GF412_04020 [Candidatus Micrarchaeota archaeon]|nr:hypothetical protein [Candidatus Micrarchaeota archaeon]MBD3418116.1 hypothetical protein [Candidatus Micrarchaeota archaeon]